MNNGSVTVQLDDDPVRFTHDGRMSVLHAIKVLTCSESPELIWEELKSNHPELLDHCSDHEFRNEGSFPVIDSEGWDAMLVMLFDYMVRR